GILDCGNSLYISSLPNYSITHHKVQMQNTNLIQTNQTVSLPININNISGGIYFADLYEVTFETDHILTDGDQCIDVWPRFSSSRGYSTTVPIHDRTYYNLDYTVEDDGVNVECTTFCWHINSSINGSLINQ